MSMQESQPTRFRFNPESEDNSESRRKSRKGGVQSYIVPAVTTVVVLLALISVPLFMRALTSVGMPAWIGFIPIAIVAAFLVALFLIKLRNPAVRTHGNHVAAQSEQVKRRNADMPAGKGIDPFLQMLDSLLDASWVVYRDVQVPNTTETIEAVLVGNTGAYVLEANTDSGNYRYREGLWEWQDWHDRWRIDQKNPLMRLHRKRDDLEYFLHANRAESKVQARVIWGGEGKIVVPDDFKEIWFTDDGGDSIWQDLHRGKIISHQNIEDICWVLDQVATRATAPGYQR